MHEPGKSDKSVVPRKSPKMDYWKLFRKHVEAMKGRDLAKENAEDGTDAALRQAGPAKQVDRTQSRVREGQSLPEDLQSALDRVRQPAGISRCIWHPYPEQRLAFVIRGKSPVR